MTHPVRSPDWLCFFERIYPSANMILIRGEQPLLVDTGFGSDLPATEQMLREVGVPPEQLHLIVNTHYHSDHVGGNSGLQGRYGLAIAAHRREGNLINRRDKEACGAEWLDQPIEPYWVDRLLSDGDEIDAEGVALQVLYTPGHTLGHIALYAPAEQILICGDALHSDDVPWLNTFLEGEDALYRALETLDRLATLSLRRAYSGHGPPIDDPLAAIDAARRRYQRWLANPQRVAWHACKRIFTYALMLCDGLPAADVSDYLLQRAWFDDYSRYVFQHEPADFVQPFLDEMLRSNAAGWQKGRLVALPQHNPPSSAWQPEAARPKDWPTR